MRHGSQTNIDCKPYQDLEKSSLKTLVRVVYHLG